MLTATVDNQSAPTRLTVVSDKRVRPAVVEIRESFTITVQSGADTATYTGTRVTTPGEPEVWAAITVTDSRGVQWKQLSDDGKTAVYGLA